MENSEIQEKFTDMMKMIVGGIKDEKSKNLFETMFAPTSNEEKVQSVFNYMTEEMAEKIQRPKSVNIEELVREKREINTKISQLSEQDQVEFWAKYHNIRTEKDIHNKLDTIFETLGQLNVNMIDNFNDIYAEIAILRQQK